MIEMKFNKIVLLDFEKTTLEKEYLDRLSELAKSVEIIGGGAREQVGENQGR